MGRYEARWKVTGGGGWNRKDNGVKRLRDQKKNGKIFLIGARVRQDVENVGVRKKNTQSIIKKDS